MTTLVMNGRSVTHMRLIDADALIEKLTKLKDDVKHISDKANDSICLVNVVQIIDFVDNAPIIDAVPTDEIRKGINVYGKIMTFDTSSDTISRAELNRIRNAYDELLENKDRAISELKGEINNGFGNRCNNSDTVAHSNNDCTLDLISRADAIDAIMGEPTDAHYPSWYADKINALPSAETHEIRTETHGVCSDLISRAEAIQTFISWEQKEFGFSDLNRGERFIDAINALPSAEAVQVWIPCSERLPDVGENVLFTTDIYGGYVAEGDRRADGKWWQYRWNSLLQNDEVLAWMPLPKPYREESEVEE